MIVLSKLLPIAVYPIGLVIECIIAALVLLYFRKLKAACTLLGLSLFILLFLSNSVVPGAMAKTLERKYLPVSEQAVKAEAIVVLGGSGRPKRFPRNHVEFNEAGERIIEGMRLYKAGAAPWVIPTGGGIDFILKGQKEALDLREVLLELGVPDSAILPQADSKNTYEDAVYVKKLMEDKKIPRNIILVTSAMHMVRAVPIFKRAGFTVIPAPVDYLIEDGNISWFHLLPSATNLLLSSQVIKEWIGIAAYKMMGWM
jgi:uncharacterized SAM-binding protein YcdF (DUF218 family)